MELYTERRSVHMSPPPRRAPGNTAGLVLTVRSVAIRCGSVCRRGSQAAFAPTFVGPTFLCAWRRFAVPVELGRKASLDSLIPTSLRPFELAAKIHVRSKSSASNERKAHAAPKEYNGFSASRSRNTHHRVKWSLIQIEGQTTCFVCAVKKNKGLDDGRQFSSVLSLSEWIGCSSRVSGVVWPLR